VLSLDTLPVCRAVYWIEVWNIGTLAEERILGSLEARPGLTPEGESAEFLLTLQTGLKLRCQLRPMPGWGTYEIVALGRIEATLP
jgi:hypothetical protein